MDVDSPSQPSICRSFRYQGRGAGPPVVSEARCGGWDIVGSQV
jgi:hypothetical protein